MAVAVRVPPDAARGAHARRVIGCPGHGPSHPREIRLPRGEPGRRRSGDPQTGWFVESLATQTLVIVSFLLSVLVFVLAYLTLAELGKARFFRAPAPARPPVAHPEVLVRRHVRKFAPRWSSPRRHRSSPVPVVSRELPPEPPRRMDASS